MKKRQKDIELVNAWNEKYPEGTPVIVTRDNGEKLETVTRSVAWSMCGNAVVSVKGISGCYALERVVPNRERCPRCRESIKPIKDMAGNLSCPLCGKSLISPPYSERSTKYDEL